jgi:hypothetical protein
MHLEAPSALGPEANAGRERSHERLPVRGSGTASNHDVIEREQIYV